MARNNDQGGYFADTRCTHSEHNVMGPCEPVAAASGCLPALMLLPLWPLLALARTRNTHCSNCGSPVQGGTCTNSDCPLSRKGG